MFGLFSFKSPDVLYGSTATVELSGNKATKIYYAHVPQVRRRIEIENLEELAALQGLVQVPDLLTIKYEGEDVISITTQRVEGYTLAELREEGYYELSLLALKAAMKATAPYQVVDLATDGNIRVQINSGKIVRIWVVDVGDIF